MATDDIEIKKAVRDRYARAAQDGSSCCAPQKGCGCGTSEVTTENASLMIGYTAEELGGLPADADLGLGCGNPAALAGLREGETVVDLGSGAGIDCFLAARRVGPKGRVIGVDMTPEMLDKARKNALTGDYANVEFRLGEIENLPAADGMVDAIISNCVINLSTDKPRVFREAFRVLRPGGRIMVSDLALLRPLPEAIRNSAEVYVACVAGALSKDDYLRAIAEAGFSGIEVLKETAYPADFILDNPQAAEVMKSLNLSAEELAGHLSSVVSLSIRAVKPV